MSHRISFMVIKFNLSDHYMTAARVLDNKFRHEMKSTKTFRRDFNSYELFITDIEQFVSQYLDGLLEITK